MRHYRGIVFVFLILTSWILRASEDHCDIFIHGWAEKHIYDFDFMEDAVLWDTNHEIPVSASMLAKDLLESIRQNCYPNQLVILRAHSYGVANAFYILGMGNRFVSNKERFQELADGGDVYAQTILTYIEIYERTDLLMSYTGGYQGTVLMDAICNSHIINGVMSSMFMGCVYSLTTAESWHVKNYVTVTGVPNYLIYATNSKFPLNFSGRIIGWAGLSFKEIMQGKYNQNDGVLPQSATRACIKVKPMFSKRENCQKIDPVFMEDFAVFDNENHATVRKKEEVLNLVP